MEDGFYVSAYLHADPLSHAIGWWQRHDQNLSLWEKRGDSVELRRYWELERATGLKQHWLSLRDNEQAQTLIASMVKQEGLALSELKGVFGTPGLDTLSDYDAKSTFPAVPYHTVCHLFSSIAVNGHEVGGRQMVALALDGGPDRVVDHSVAYDAEYAAAIVRDGAIKVEPVLVSPGRLWFIARERFGMREGTLMALQTAATVTFRPPPLPAGDLGSFSRIHSYLEQAWDRIELTGPEQLENVEDWDPRFTVRENQLSMATKLLHEVSTAIVDSLIARLLSDHDLDPRETVLAVSGGYALNCLANSHLLKKRIV